MPPAFLDPIRVETITHTPRGARGLGPSSCAGRSLPEISRFLGIAIFMFWDDHGPPHFHARYGDERAKVSISPVSLVAGRLPPRVLALIVEWASLHQAELLANWDRCRRRQPPVRIPPLE
jgi:hypothetical protein